jgi:hypothetical protein
MANYDSKPSVYEANGNGSYTYRWDIREVKGDANENGEERSSWECEETVVFATVTRSKLTAAVLASKWAPDYESKLVNDFNAAREGVFGPKTGEEAKKYIDRYKAFLENRRATKEQVLADCEALQIPL